MGSKYLARNPVTAILILINVIIFVVLNSYQDLASVFLLDPNMSVVVHKPWTLFTVFFSHEVLVHILLNMGLILVFGTRLELSQD